MKANLTEPITLCLINYNGLAYLQQAFAALQTLQTKFDEILVVDNASNDGSLTYLETLEQVSVIALSSNTGPSGARNAGYSQAKNDIILFQDNDICLTEGVAEALYNTLKQDQRRLITMPRVVYKSDPETIQFEGADCHFLGMMLLRQANVLCSQTPTVTAQTSSLVSACFMIDRSRYHNQRLFDEGLIFNLEDHDLGVRVNMLGFSTLVVPAATVLHGSGTRGLSYRPGNKVSAIRIYCLIRNRWWIIWRYYSLRTLIVLAPLLLLFELWQLTGLLFKGWGREWMRAFIDTGKHFSRLYEERKTYQAQRRRADRDILRGGNLPFTQAMNSNSLTRAVVKIFESIMFVYWSLAKKIV
jgi:GT2 family glycosyltransferase